MPSSESLARSYCSIRSLVFFSSLRQQREKREDRSHPLLDAVLVVLREAAKEGKRRSSSARVLPNILYGSECTKHEASLSHQMSIILNSTVRELRLDPLAPPGDTHLQHQGSPKVILYGSMQKVPVL